MGSLCFWKGTCTSLSVLLIFMLPVRIMMQSEQETSCRERSLRTSMRRDERRSTEKVVKESTESDKQLRLSTEGANHFCKMSKTYIQDLRGIHLGCGSETEWQKANLDTVWFGFNLPKVQEKVASFMTSYKHNPLIFIFIKKRSFNFMSGDLTSCWWYKNVLQF